MTVSNLISSALDGSLWSAKSLHESLAGRQDAPSERTVLRAISEFFAPEVIADLDEVTNSEGHALNPLITQPLKDWASSKRKSLEILQVIEKDGCNLVILANLAGRLMWTAVKDADEISLQAALVRLVIARGGGVGILPHGDTAQMLETADLPESAQSLASLLPPVAYRPPRLDWTPAQTSHRHLDELERESIEIIREAYAAASNPAMLFSMGKDSMVMLSLALKAFAPEPLPFPLAVIDTRWKFQDMYRFREYLQSRDDLSVMVYVNPEAIERDMNPFDFGSALHTDITKTQALRKVLDQHDFDFVFGGARRDEEKSRAKERVFSIRSASHGWDPKNQRPELWNLYNTTLVDGQKMRVFPLSNWTELDIWRYIERESIELVPLYLSKLRPYVERNGSLIMIDDERFPLEPDEKVHLDFIRFRTLGCYPLTGGVKSRATSVSDIVTEIEATHVSERSSRVIDFDAGASMEQKKKDGYF